MNTEKHLILIKGEEKTEAIRYCEYKDGKWQVQFVEGKKYPYSYHNVKWYKDPILLDSKITVIYINNQPLSGVNKIIDFKEYIRVYFVTGYKKVYSKREITIEKSCLSNVNFQNTFEYLKQLAEKVSIVNGEEGSFLSNQYEKITYISENSVLSKYLHMLSLDKPKEIQMPIFPFGFNLSQKSATEKALANQISVIEGPPGTGKTQTILNIISNAIINDKTVAVVSNNNSATANVLEKLQKYGVGFIAAYLGNKENKDKFFSEQIQTYPDMNTWRIDAKSYRDIKRIVERNGNELRGMLESKNKVAILKQELSALLVEKDYFYNYYYESNEKIEPYRSLIPHNSDIMIALWLECQRMAEKGSSVTLKYKLRNLLRYGIVSFSFYKNSSDKVIALFQKLYYEKKIDELDKQIKTLTEKLESYQFDSAMKKYSEDSMKLLKAKLAERYSSNKNRQLYKKEVLWKDFGSFINEYPVIMSTTHSLRNCADTNYLFDYVIMDEASQIDIVTGALALSCARNAVIVGDLKQLPNVVSQDIKEETNLIFERFSLSRSYNYSENSILSSIAGLYKNVPKTLLKEHYRCHPKIIGFCNQKFYDNELIILTNGDDQDKPLVVYKTAKGNHARGTYNQRQIDVILKEVLPQQIADITKQSIGIISPYRLQTDKLKISLGKTNIEVDTVHKYQGREKDIVILTTVANEVNEFVDNPNLINVAVSRAVDKLVVVVSDNEKNEKSNIGDLVRYIDYNNFEIINSSIYSVFDLLYRKYSERLFEVMKNKKNVSDYESENLMITVIEKVISQPEFHNLDYVMHQPLKMLIRNLQKLNEKECQFVMNALTHTDFVIFNKLDKMPVLVVEVDGYAFHVSNPKQAARDRLKDTILEKYCIPILRIKTNESGEEEKLHNKLIQILN